MLFLYKIFYTIFILPVMMLLPKTRAGLKQRLGFHDFKNEEKTLWIHAVSVGELLALHDFIKKIEGFEIVLSTSTPQGMELAKSKMSEYCKQIVYFPYDCDCCIQGAIKAINPGLVLIMETEIWPAFLQTLKRKGVPAMIINGRISERTFKSYRRLKFFFKPIMQMFTGVLAQSDADAQRFIDIGASPESVRVMGNIKFDIQKPDIKTLDLELNDNPLFIAGSTHSGEDKIALDAYLEAKKNKGNLKFLLVPRHLERLEEIKDVLSGLKFGLKSKGATFKDYDILILDTTGELAAAYAYSTVAFIGGSFNNTGGHNPLEASIWNKPVLSGPNIKNFRHIYGQLCEFGCAKIVETPEELSGTLSLLLDDEQGELYRIQMSENCKIVFKKNRGATDYLMSLLFKWRKYDN